MNTLIGTLAVLIGLGLAAVAVATDKPQEKEEWEHKDAADMVKDVKTAALGTSDKGQPFVSLTPYALDAKGQPFVFISTLAFHTKNLKAKAESSLMVMKADEKDIFNSARCTFVGKMKPVDNKDEVAALKKVYFAKYPAAKDLEEFHDFGFYQMEIEKIQYIGGFGDIRWIKGSEWTKNYK